MLVDDPSSLSVRDIERIRSHIQLINGFLHVATKDWCTSMDVQHVNWAEFLAKNASRDERHIMFKRSSVKYLTPEEAEQYKVYFDNISL